LGPVTTVTPFHHQPEAQHPKSSAIHKNAGRLPHLSGQSGHSSTLALDGFVAIDPGCVKTRCWI
jgi:hypothetical protein